MQSMIITGPARRERQQQFAAYIRKAALEEGYQLDGPRGGGKSVLAEKTGMSLASVSRMLSGDSLPDAGFLEDLADVLGLEYWEVFEQAGVVRPHTLRPPARPEQPKLTVDTAARELGITKPEAVAAFKAMVAALRDPEPED